MLDLYYWTTPNGHKITMFLEEAELEYNLIAVHIGKGEQFAPEFLRVAPNNRIPALVDNDQADGGEPISVFESGAILLYLADKYGQFIPPDARGRADVVQWLMWQMGGLGPMLGQNHHFVTYAPERVDYAMNRYVNETARLYAVLNKQLSDREFITGDYSIADMACYPWIVPHKRQRQDLNDFPHLQRWFDAIRERPATVRAYDKGKAINTESTMTEEAKRVLFGQTAATVR